MLNKRICLSAFHTLISIYLPITDLIMKQRHRIIQSLPLMTQHLVTNWITSNSHDIVLKTVDTAVGVGFYF